MEKIRIGLLVTTFNRPEYLERCMDSLKKADLKDVRVLFVDDASTDQRTIELIKNFPSHYSIIQKTNTGIAGSLLKGYNFFFSMGCEFVINLDSDAIVKKDFIKKISDLRYRFTNDIITGFNTITKNENGIVRHPILEQHEDYCIKKSCGGINYLITRKIYDSFLQKALKNCIGKKGDWDNYFCGIAQSNNIKYISTTPSVVQHIGEESSIGKRVNPDKAHDFINDDTIIINQPRGLGDIIFSMKAVLEFANGRNIIWPVVENFENIGKHFPGIMFVDWKKFKLDYNSNKQYYIEDGLVVPLRYSDSLCGVKYNECMKSKHIYFGYDWQNWKDIKMVRDNDSENILFDKMLSEYGIEAGEKYNLINKNFRTDKSGVSNILPNNGLKNILMREVPGFTLIDWSKIIQEAEHIYTVGTSINYLIELIEIKAKTINLYVRKPDEKDFKNYDYILSESKPYLFNY